jgi:2-iminobutanoate/2-iminopropanoate deaminase
VSKTAITTDKAPRPVASYSQAVRVGNMLQVSGQGPGDPATGELVGTTAGEQTEQTMQNLTAILDAAGASLDDVVMLRVYLTDRTDFADMNEVYARYVNEPFPARTTVFTGLGAGMLVEIDALAVLP